MDKKKLMRDLMVQEQLLRGSMAYCGLMRAIEIVDRQPEDEWIPVTERLPDPDVMVLVSTKAKSGTRSVNRAYCDGCFWHGSGSMAGVTAWMPLPKPYREEDA